MLPIKIQNLLKLSLIFDFEANYELFLKLNDFVVFAQKYDTGYTESTNLCLDFVKVELKEVVGKFETILA